jgi:SAM-dependent methyltransferase
MSRMEWFVQQFVPLRGRRLRVLDVGSYDVNGTYRIYFPETRFEYTGLDMTEGPNVDIVPSKVYSWEEVADDYYDIVISGQTLEHVEFFWLIVAEMTRILKKDGTLCIIVPNGFEEHRHPVDCWRFFTDGMIALARYVNLTVLHAHTNCAPSIDDKGQWYDPNCPDAMLVATKPYSGKAMVVDIEKYKCIPADLESARAGLIPLW